MAIVGFAAWEGRANTKYVLDALPINEGQTAAFALGVNNALAVRWDQEGVSRLDDPAATALFARRIGPMNLGRSCVPL